MKPDPTRAGRTFNEGATRHDAMSKAFAYAHGRDDVVWMSQNTNHLPTHPAIEQAIRDSAACHEYNKYPLARGLPRLRELIREDLGLPDAGMHITNGGTEGLYCLMRYLQPPGSRMITSDLLHHPQIRQAWRRRVHRPAHLRRQLPLRAGCSQSGDYAGDEEHTAY